MNQISEEPSCLALFNVKFNAYLLDAVEVRN